MARQQGIIAAYLNIFAIIFSLVLAMLGTGLTLGLYLPVYYLEKCKDKLERDGYRNTYHPYSYYYDDKCYTTHY